MDSVRRLRTKVFCTRSRVLNCTLLTSLAIVLREPVSSRRWSNNDFCLMPRWTATTLIVSIAFSVSLKVALTDWRPRSSAVEGCGTESLNTQSGFPLRAMISLPKPNFFNITRTLISLIVIQIFCQ